MRLTDLPLLNAGLNFTSAILLSIGYVHIRNQRIIAHRNCMISAFVTSTLFLISYLYYHAHVPSTHFVNPAWFRPIYLTILLTHTVLAMVIVPMVIITLSRAL